jgi:hypothetical protein
MTQLSPTAQSTLDAFLSEWDVYAVAEARAAMAAAIKALVEALTYTDDYGTEYISPADALAVAAELEGKP